MNPIWDYVKKVEQHLPQVRRAQVGGALYATLKARKEALEKANGHKATDAEIADMLAAEGDPAAVAQRLSGAPGEPDLVVRYIASIERRLPREGVLDVMAELREALMARIEAKEDELGRAASADEIAQILKDYGHPVVVASRYAEHDYVIGPRYYPWFWHVQRLAVGAAIAITFAIVAIRALGSEEPIRAVFRGIGGAVEAALIAFAVVAVLFIAAERNKLDLKWAERWNPKDLPRDHVREPKTLLETSISLFFDLIFLLWWLKIVRFPNEIPVRDDASAAIHFTAAWGAVYWPILVLAAAAVLVHLVDLVRPAWTPLRAGVRIAGHVVGMGVLWVLFQSRPLVEVVGLNGASEAETERVRELFSSITTISLGVTALVWGVAIGVEVWRLSKSYRPSGRVRPLAI